MTASILLATRNAHKASEIRALLPSTFQLSTLSDFPGAPVAIEDQDTFAGNAAKKAVTLAKWLVGRVPSRGVASAQRSERSFIMADDSGLEVDALRGAPGVHSARYAHADSSATGNASDADNNAKLLRELQGIPLEKRLARFRCVIALAEVVPVPGTADNENVRLFEGKCEGRIGFAPQGADGFGYDPLFIPAGFEITFAQLGEEAKNRISHRAIALRQFLDWTRAI